MLNPNLPLDKCTACGACVSVCSKDAIQLVSDEEGFYIPVCDESKCIGCKLCESVCHVLNSTHPRVDPSYVDAFMLKANDKELVKKSSSGGAYSLLANYVLDNGGCVYGAAYDYKGEVLTCSSTQECSLDVLRKSKYVESFMGNTFRKIGRNLKENRLVLFCGTPCQCRGLLSYIHLKKLSNKNLLIVRFICHGVPSNKFLTDYKHWMENKNKSKVVEFDFRPKNFGWRQQSMRLIFENGTVYTQPNISDLYLTCFYKSVNLRKSCYECSFDKEDYADLTIGDFWGIKSYCPNNKDQEGISVVLAHNEKGLACLDNLLDKCSLERLPSHAVKYIFNDFDDSKDIEKRRVFMQSVIKKGYMSAALDSFGSLMRKNKIRWLWRQLKKKISAFPQFFLKKGF